MPGSIIVPTIFFVEGNPLREVKAGVMGRFAFSVMRLDEAKQRYTLGVELGPLPAPS